MGNLFEMRIIFSHSLNRRIGVKCNQNNLVNEAVEIERKMAYFMSLMREKENDSNERIRSKESIECSGRESFMKIFHRQQLCQRIMKRLRALTIIRNININEVKLTLDLKESQIAKTQIRAQTQISNKNIQAELSNIVKG